MLVEPRQDFHEIARSVAIIELVRQDLVPGVLAGAGRARQAEHISRVGDAGGSARLYRRGADLLLTHQQEQRREAVHALLEQRLDRLRRHVAAGKAGAAGGDDDIDAGIGDPALDGDADRLDVISDDLARGELVTGRDQTVRVAGSRTGRRTGQATS